MRAMVDRAVAEPSESVLASPAEQAEQAVEDAAGKVGRPGRGQGFQLDQEAKAAIETLAMLLPPGALTAATRAAFGVGSADQSLPELLALLAGWAVVLIGAAALTFRAE